MKFLKIGMFLAMALAMTMGTANAGGTYGKWLRTKTGEHVTSYPCGGGLGLRGVRNGKPLIVMCGAKHIGGGKYKGRLTSPDDGNTYSGTVSVKRTKLVLSGCVLGGLICKSETWRRLK